MHGLMRPSLGQHGPRMPYWALTQGEGQRGSARLLPATDEQADGAHQLTIGEAAERTGLTRKAIRLYEHKGLLPPARRSNAGYRLYSADDLAVLGFIRRARRWTCTWTRSATSSTFNAAANSPAATSSASST